MMEQLNLAFWAWVQSVRGIGRRRIWGPFLAVLGVNLVLILLLTQFYRPVIAWFMVPLLRTWVPAGALHYPAVYQALPQLIYPRVNLVFDLILGSFLFGVAYLVIWGQETGLGAPQPWHRGAKAWPRLFLLRVPVVVLLLISANLIAVLAGAGGDHQVRGNALRLLLYGPFLAGVIVESLFIFTPIALLGAGRSLFGAFLESFRVFGRAPLATLLVVGVPNLAQLGVSWVFRRSNDIVVNLNPEVVGWIVVGGAIVYVLVNYFVLAGAVRIFAARSDSAEGGRAWAA